MMRRIETLETVMTAIMPTLIGHRGVASEAPENTAASIKRAAELGIEWIELDVTLAGDGSLVMLHDADLKRFTGKATPISDMTRVQLEAIDAGGWFDKAFEGEKLLFLEETLALVDRLGLGLNLEIKINPDLPYEELVDRILVTSGLTPLLNRDALLISSFCHPALARVAQTLPNCPLGALIHGVDRHWADTLEGFTPSTINTDAQSLTRALADEIRARFPLYCYTVNDARTLEKLLSWGASGVFSDRAHARDLREKVGVA